MYLLLYNSYFPDIVNNLLITLVGHKHIISHAITLRILIIVES